MNAIVITKFGGPEVLEFQTVAKPVPTVGEVTIQVKAFGLNHAEHHMRAGEWDVYNRISGLEAVGIVTACPGGELNVGDKVIAAMGGMGRERPGSYGEYVNVPASNVAAVKTDLPWEVLAALPEVYLVAWTCLFTILDLKKGERLLLRGATSTLGDAALKLAASAGAIVTATTRTANRFAQLCTAGATHTLLEHPNLASELPSHCTFDKTLNLIGNSILVESIALTRPHGRMLQAGWLGGLTPLVGFNPMLEMASGVHFSLFHSKTLGGPAFPLKDIPVQAIVDLVESGQIDASPKRVFRYRDIVAAHQMLDSGVGGKLVVTHEM